MQPVKYTLKRYGHDIPLLKLNSTIKKFVPNIVSFQACIMYGKLIYFRKAEYPLSWLHELFTWSCLPPGIRSRDHYYSETLLTLGYLVPMALPCVQTAHSSTSTRIFILGREALCASVANYIRSANLLKVKWIVTICHVKI